MGDERKRRRLPARDWPAIVTRYLDGVPLAQIAREHKCSARTISAVLRRAGFLSAATISAAPGPAGKPTRCIALRSRIARALALLSGSLNAVSAQSTKENIAELRYATDQLMRAIARVRIELRDIRPTTSPCRGPRERSPLGTPTDAKAGKEAAASRNKAKVRRRKPKPA